MGTHVHLLMETRRVALSKILQGINQSSTMYLNCRYATLGHLFQGRYKAMSLVAKEYGYKGEEIAGYLWRDPSVITRYLKEGNKLAAEAGKVHALLRQDSNKQV